jgi:luciferase family oxidoreductase group 1
MDLGVHDLVTLNNGETPEEGYERTKRFVQEIEKMNFKRYWFAEHHNSEGHASSSPELMAAYMSAITDNLRFGTGGTMIMHYSPLKIAENFKTLITLAPNRIDLGLGRAPGGGPNEIVALAQGKPDAFDDQYDKIEVILNYLLDEKAPNIYGESRAVPNNTATLPEPWMLGSSGQSALKSAQMGLGYSFAKFFGIETDPSVFQLYRDRFEPSKFFEKPKVMVSYQIIIADSEEEADYLAKPIELAQLALASGKLLPNLHPEEVKDYEFTQEHLNYLNERYEKRFLIKGTPKQVQNILEEEQKELGIDELMVYAPIFNHEARVNSYKELARMFNKI